MLGLRASGRCKSACSDNKGPEFLFDGACACEEHAFRSMHWGAWETSRLERFDDLRFVLRPILSAYFRHGDIGKRKRSCQDSGAWDVGVRACEVGATRVGSEEMGHVEVGNDASRIAHAQTRETGVEIQMLHSVLVRLAKHAEWENTEASDGAYRCIAEEALGSRQNRSRHLHRLKRSTTE